MRARASPATFVSQKSVEQKLSLPQNSVEAKPLAEFCQTLCRNLHGVRVHRNLQTRRTVRNKGGSVLPKTGVNPN